MSSYVRYGAVAVVLLLAHSAPADADPYQLGGFFGPRFFSDDSALGSKETFHDTLDTTFTLGARLGRPLYPWLIPEIELPLAVATTHQYDVSVLWVEPRVHARIIWPHGQLRPFAVLGAGLPMDSSAHRGIFGADISWEGYGGMGATYAPGHGLSFRADLRVGITQGYLAPIAVEVEGGLGLYIELGHREPARGKGELLVTATDRDGDGVPDATDQCPDRPEDDDQFQDADGCPDIDNDLDHVLDIADQCPTVPEIYNGFEDDDGCADSVPGDLSSVLGTLEGAVYAEGVVDVPEASKPALAKIAAALAKFPTVRIIVNGYTDDQEAHIDPVDGEDAESTRAREDDALRDLSKTRAQKVADALDGLGVDPMRVLVDGKGDTDPISDNDSPRHRKQNRRVEVMLYVPPDASRR
jgi:outer membrane protein OmpA-like peptidoglycan-associated protein